MRKILSYIFILAILLGTFSPLVSVHAQNPPATAPSTAAGTGTCQWTGITGDAPTPHVQRGVTHEDCKGLAGKQEDGVSQNAYVWTPDTGGAPVNVGSTGFITQSSGSALWNQLDNCNPFFGFGPGSVMGCVQIVTYAVFVALPSILLGVVAVFFNFMAEITLSSHMYTAEFIEKIWRVVRDFANIFFILVLLYAALQTILGIGHGGAKKTIAAVIVIALVVNFSLFFTKVVIDSSNILALIFYNKVNTTQVKNTPIGGDFGVAKKDIGGAFASRFNPNAFFSEEGTFKKLNEYGQRNGVQGVNSYTLFAMMFIYGIVVYVLIYALFIVGFSLLGRTLMLMSLMVVSPFAFVSYTIPAFKKIDSIGFDSWLHKLLNSSFVAALLMFIFYLISEVLAENVFGSPKPDQDGILGYLVLTFLPGILIAVLLLQGAKYAKKASGEFTGAVISGAKVAGGLVLGGAALTTGLAGRATVGAFMKGAATGDSANQRYAAGAPMRGRWDTFKGWAGHNLTAGRLTAAQVAVGRRINADQTRVEQSAHSRHTLDEYAKNRYQGKTYNQLSGPERTWVQNRIDQDILTRNRVPIMVNGVAYDYGNRQKFSELSDDAQTALTAHLNGMAPAQRAAIQHGSVQTIRESLIKQGIGSTIMQAFRTGSYDVRGIASAVAKEYNTGFAKFATGLTAAIAMGMRGGLKNIGVNHGEVQKSFFKDLLNTISDALKGAKINVDVSHVGEEKKESGGGGHH